MSKFMINFLVDWELMNAEEELKRIKERQREGIDVALNKGIKFGRPPVQIDDDFKHIYNEWKAGNITAVSAYKNLKISKTSFYKKVKEHENKI